MIPIENQISYLKGISLRMNEIKKDILEHNNKKFDDLYLKKWDFSDISTKLNELYRVTFGAFEYNHHLNPCIKAGYMFEVINEHNNNIFDNPELYGGVHIQNKYKMTDENVIKKAEEINNEIEKLLMEIELFIDYNDQCQALLKKIKE